MKLMSIIKPLKDENPPPSKMKIIVTEAQLKMIVENTKNEISQIIERYAVQNQKVKR